MVVSVYPTQGKVYIENFGNFIFQALLHIRIAFAVILCDAGIQIIFSGLMCVCFAHAF